MTDTERAARCLKQAMRQKDTHTYVVRTEHLEEDLQGVFTWLCASPVATASINEEDYTGRNDTALSGGLGKIVALSRSYSAQSYPAGPREGGLLLLHFGAGASTVG